MALSLDDAPDLMVVSEFLKHQLVPVSRNTLYKYISSGEVPTIRMGAHVFVIVKALRERIQKAANPSEQRKTDDR